MVLETKNIDGDVFIRYVWINLYTNKRIYSPYYFKDDLIYAKEHLNIFKEIINDSFDITIKN